MMASRGIPPFLLAVASVWLTTAPSFGGFLDRFCRHGKHPVLVNPEHGYFATQWTPWPAVPAACLSPAQLGAPLPAQVPATPALPNLDKPEPESVPAPKLLVPDP